MKKTIIKNAKIVNRGKIFEGDLLIEDERIKKIAANIELREAEEVDAKGNFLLPGIVDDQVHFREPGLVHKANIYTEAKAAVAGGTTTFMEMPNTKPAALSQEKLQEKYDIAAQYALANHSFFMGASNDNLEEVLKTDGNKVCGIKIFMGSSTGNMLVDNQKTLDKLFAEVPILIATHCEDEATIRTNLDKYKAKYGEEIPIACHPEIRNEEGCYLSSSLAIDLAKKHDTRLHILHISTERELELFTNKIPLAEKRITAEVCVHHLYFNANDYDKFGTKIKCNPAVKAPHHQEALFKALLDDRLDIIATDHAPHTSAEKANKYLKAPSGVPLVQHSLNVMMEFYHQGKISIEKIVEKMSHAPAVCFDLKERGYVEEGMYADIVLLDAHKKWTVNKDNIHYKCRWSPFENHSFTGKVISTFVNGHHVYKNGVFDESIMGKRVEFSRY